jgi:hypothetical protein
VVARLAVVLAVVDQVAAALKAAIAVVVGANHTKFACASKGNPLKRLK